MRAVGEASEGEPPKESANRSVAVGGVVNLVGHLLGGLEPLFVMAVSWILGAAVLGSYVLAVTYIVLLLRLVELGLDKGLLRHVPIARTAGDEEAVASVLGTALKAMAALAVLGTGVVLLLADLIVSRGGGDTAGDGGTWLALMALAVPAEALSLFFVYALRGGRQMAPFVVVRDVVRPALLFAVTLGAVPLGAGHFSPIAGYLAAQVGAAVAGLVYYRRAFPRQGLARLLRARIDRDLLAFSAPQGLTEFLNYLLGRADILMLGAFFPDRPELLAIYGVATMIAGSVKLARQAFDTSLAPVMSELLARGEREELAATYRATSRWILALWFLIAGVVVLAAPLILRAFGPEYPEHWVVVPILVAGRFFNVLFGPSAMALLMAGRSKLELANNALTNVGNIALNLFLIPRYGLVGAAVATSTSIGLFNVLRFVQVNRLVGLRPALSDVVRTCLAGGLAMALAAAALALPWSLASCAVAAAAFVLLAPALLWAFGGREDLRALLRWRALARPRAGS